MSNSDSFIEEVSEEVRRDRLFHLLRRYGWIAVVVVIALVGGAAFWEVRKAQTRAANEAFGDAILSALESDTAEERRAALGEIEAEGAQKALVAMLAADTLDTTETEQQTAETLAEIAASPDLPEIYRHLATLKAAMLAQDTDTPDAVQQMLQPLLVPGAPYRLLAQEQVAISQVAAGDADAALATLTSMLSDGEVTAGLRTRVQQLIVALGGSLDAT